jgi:hypothetical protein
MPYAKTLKNYLTTIKDWKIRNMVHGYIEARMLFKSFRLDAKSKRIIPSEELHKICDILFDVKQIYQLLYRLPDDPPASRGVAKIPPKAPETEFFNNLGLLFHKVLMTRELRYINENYPTAQTAQQNGFDTVKESLEQIDKLFDDGVQCVMNLIQAHRENPLLIAYLFEDSYRIGKVLGTDCDALLMGMTEKPTTELACMMTARYYIESGWYEKASEMLKRALKVNPANDFVKQLLDRYAKMRSIES